MAEMYKITVVDQEGNVKKELMAEGYLICSFTDERDLGDDVKLKCNATVVADNVTAAEVASVMMHEETPLGQARKMLDEMEKKKGRLSKLLATIGKKG